MPLELWKDITSNFSLYNDDTRPRIDIVESISPKESWSKTIHQWHSLSKHFSSIVKIFYELNLKY